MSSSDVTADGSPHNAVIPKMAPSEHPLAVGFDKVSNALNFVSLGIKILDLHKLQKQYDALEEEHNKKLAIRQVPKVNDEIYFQMQTNRRHAVEIRKDFTDTIALIFAAGASKAYEKTIFSWFAPTIYRLGIKMDAMVMPANAGMTGKAVHKGAEFLGRSAINTLHLAGRNLVPVIGAGWGIAESGKDLHKTLQSDNWR